MKKDNMMIKFLAAGENNVKISNKQGKAQLKYLMV